MPICYPGYYLQLLKHADMFSWLLLAALDVILAITCIAALEAHVILASICKTGSMPICYPGYYLQHLKHAIVHPGRYLQHLEYANMHSGCYSQHLKACQYAFWLRWASQNESLWPSKAIRSAAK